MASDIFEGCRLALSSSAELSRVHIIIHPVSSLTAESREPFFALFLIIFLSDPGVPGVRSMGPVSVTQYERFLKLN